jgi:hypothetical protein
VGENVLINPAWAEEATKRSATAAGPTVYFKKLDFILLFLFNTFPLNLVGKY